jgi:Zn-dependent M28 family amino/carboxypeptidase
MIELRRGGLLLGLAVAAAFVSCGPEGGGPGSEAVEVHLPSDAIMDAALASITEKELMDYSRVLGSDEFQGRAPSSPGEEKTMAFLTERFGGLGLEPGGPGGSWMQEVPMVSITADPRMVLRVDGGGQSSSFRYGPDLIAWTTRVVDEIDVADSELVFVGYGIIAPEYGWNDYEGVDVSGKTVVVLVNDPGFATQDPEIFNGNSMTYYGRWTYKYEEAARQGAAGVLLVHETAPAAYGWATVEGTWSGKQFGLVAEDNNMSRVAFESWISHEAAQTIFAQAGMDYEEMKAQALTPTFRAVPMGITGSLSFHNDIVRSTSNNFLAKIPGTTRPDEVVIYMGHWDHFGMDPSLEGDQIFNGAVDNATGIAALLEMAQAFKMLEPGPERTVVFMATTAEEQGLLGSSYYGENPVYPLNKTVAAINIDALSIFGETRDYVISGYGNSELDDYAVRYNRMLDRVVKPDPEPEKGGFFRSDHFPLAKQGVPAHYGSAGFDNVEHGEEWGRARSDEWLANNYHQVTDEFSEDWDLSGALQDISVWFRMGAELAYSDAWPQWNEGTEFKAIRDASMGR